MESPLESIEFVDLNKITVTNESDSASKSIINEHQLVTVKAAIGNDENPNEACVDVDYKIIPTTEVLSKWSQNDDSHMEETAIALSIEWQTQSTVNQPTFEYVECVKQRMIDQENAINVTTELNKSSENPSEVGNIFKNKCEFASSSEENTQSIDNSETGYIEGIASNAEEFGEHQAVKVASTDDSETGYIKGITSDAEEFGEHQAVKVDSIETGYIEGITSAEEELGEHLVKVASTDDSETGHVEGIANDAKESREHQVVKLASTSEAEMTTKNTSHLLSKFKNAQMAVDFFSSELLCRKGYNLRSFSNIRLLVNLPLIKTVCTMNVILCTNLPYHMRENHLTPLFEKYGKIYQLRMNLKDKNTNLSEAFVTYTTQDDAENAIKSLHRREIQGQIISVAKFVHDLRVLIKPIPSSATEYEVFNKFKCSNGLLKVTFNEEDNKNRGFCFLHYQNYELAQNAKRYLSNKSFFGRIVHSAWPRSARDDDKKLLSQDNVESSYSRPLTKMTDQQMPNEKNDASHTLYVSNLHSDIHATDLRKIFSVYGEIGHIDKDDNFASVEFRNGKDSILAAHEIDKKLLGKENVQISHSTSPTKIDEIVTATSNELNNNNISGNVNISPPKKINLTEPYQRERVVITLDKRCILKHLKL